MRPVVSNKLQGSLNRITNEALSPGTGTTHSAIGTLLEVYDQERLRSTSLDRKLQRELEANPGLLFAKIQIRGAGTHVLPFYEPGDQIYLTYGNAIQLEGKRAKVEWSGMNITSGHILLTRTYDEKQISIPDAGLIFDIGNII